MIDTFTLYMGSAYRPIAGAETPPAAAAPPEGQTEEPAEDPQKPLLDRMDQVVQRIGDLEQRIPAQQDPGQQTQPPDSGFDPYGQPQMGQPGDPNQQQYQDPNQYDPYAGPIDPAMVDPNDPQAALAIVRQEAERAAQAAIQGSVQPEFQRQHQERIAAELDQFVSDYPELEAREAQQSLASDTQEWVADVLRDVPGLRSDPQLAQALAQSPAILELVHLAAKTAERAQQEQPAGQAQAEVTPEGGSASNPGGGASEANLGEQIKAGAPPKGFWIN